MIYVNVKIMLNLASAYIKQNTDECEADRAARRVYPAFWNWMCIQVADTKGIFGIHRLDTQIYSGLGDDRQAMDQAVFAWQAAASGNN